MATGAQRLRTSGGRVRGVELGQLGRKWGDARRWRTGDVDVKVEMKSGTGAAVEGLLLGAVVGGSVDMVTDVLKLAGSVRDGGRSLPLSSFGSEKD